MYWSTLRVCNTKIRRKEKERLVLIFHVTVKDIKKSTQYFGNQSIILILKIGLKIQVLIQEVKQNKKDQRK